VQKRRLTLPESEPSARDVREADTARRRAADDAVIAALAERLAPDARDDGAARAFLERHGPFELQAVRVALDGLLAERTTDLHPSVLLEELRRRLGGRP
jgi:hypothetical protein